ncbi:hypothetical protein LXL04_034343 [Taraxacum kok-saghyz]
MQKCCNLEGLGSKLKNKKMEMLHTRDFSKQILTFEIVISMSVRMVIHMKRHITCFPLPNTGEDRRCHPPLATTSNLWRSPSPSTAAAEEKSRRQPSPLVLQQIRRPLEAATTHLFNFPLHLLPPATSTTASAQPTAIPPVRRSASAQPSSGDRFLHIRLPVSVFRYFPPVCFFPPMCKVTFWILLRRGSTLVVTHLPFLIPGEFFHRCNSTYPKRYSIREVRGSMPIPGLVTSAAYTTKSALTYPKGYSCGSCGGRGQYRGLLPVRPTPLNPPYYLLYKCLKELNISRKFLGVTQSSPHIFFHHSTVRCK